MAAGPRPVLLLAAIALLAVTASCERGYLKRRRNGSSPAPLVYSFGWGAITIDRNDERSCQFVCRNYGLDVVRDSNTVLCSYNSPAAGRTTVYGTYYPAGTGTPVAEFDTCRVVLANGTRITNEDEGVFLYRCGCCGAITRRGVAPRCPTTVVRYVDQNATCPPNVAWTAGAGGDGLQVCLRLVNNVPGSPMQFGTIYNNVCRIYGNAAPLPFQRVCLRVNSV